MKLIATIAIIISIPRALLGGESSLTSTYQPLDGLGSGEITISQVTCHDWYSHSGQATSISLISVPNVPPTNNPKEATENLNLASVCGVRFGSSDIGDPKVALELTIDVTKFVIPKRFGHPRENIIRACLECLRRCLPNNLRHTPLTLRASDEDLPWVSEIVREFNAHDRTKAFYKTPHLCVLDAGGASEPPIEKIDHDPAKPLPTEQTLVAIRSLPANATLEDVLKITGKPGINYGSAIYEYFFRLDDPSVIIVRARSDGKLISIDHQKTTVTELLTKP